MKRLSNLILACLFTLTLSACPMESSFTQLAPLPRNMALKAFEPHRPSFDCKHEASAVPPIDREAEDWLQEGMRLTSGDLWPNQRNYPKAVELWAKAAERKHWKAMMNLAGVYIEGDGTAPFVVPADPERAVKLVEYAMGLGIPAAFDAMGTYHQKGLGVKPDISRAYAFWELAADMGSPDAQTHLGDALNATYDNPREGFWGNRVVGLQMLECAFAQGHGKAAYVLGMHFMREAAKDYPRALRVLHEGVKFGSEQSANTLSTLFRGAELGNGGPPVDPARDERYSALGDALYNNPDLRFPNLDKILPLPPAQLPKWNGDKDMLLNAAKGVLPAPIVKPTPGAKLSGRAHIPDGWVLPAEPVPPQMEAVGRPFRTIPAQYESTAARFTGYWLAQLLDSQTERHAAWDSAQVPQRYALGESFESQRQSLGPGAGRVIWHYLGVPVKQAASAQRPEVTQGIARSIRIPEPYQRCQGNAACTHTGIWYAEVDPAHPYAKTYNRWSQQAYVEQGAAFPQPQDRHLDIKPAEMRWLWLGNANRIDNALGDTGFAHVSLDEAQTPKPGAKPGEGAAA